VTVSVGARLLFAVIGFLSIATLWRVWPRTDHLASEVIPPEATPVQRLLYTILPYVLPVVFAVSVLYCVVSLAQ
jgi:hypothetical protein